MRLPAARAAAATRRRWSAFIRYLRSGSGGFELLLLGRLMLAEIDNEEAIHRILEKEGDRVAAARREMAEQVLHHGYRNLVDIFAPWLGPDVDDPDAFVVVLIGGLVNLRRNRWTFGAVPLGVEDDRALDAWVDIALAALDDNP